MTEWVRVGDISNDPKYNPNPSGVDPSRVRYLLDHYDPRKVGILSLVERPGGTLQVFDGSHRREAIEKKYGADHLVECEVARRPRRGQVCWRVSTVDCDTGQLYSLFILRSLAHRGFSLAPGSTETASLDDLRDELARRIAAGEGLDAQAVMDAAVRSFTAFPRATVRPLCVKHDRPPGDGCGCGITVVPTLDELLAQSRSWNFSIPVIWRCELLAGAVMHNPAVWRPDPPPYRTLWAGRAAWPWRPGADGPHLATWRTAGVRIRGLILVRPASLDPQLVVDKLTDRYHVPVKVVAPFVRRFGLNHLMFGHASRSLAATHPDEHETRVAAAALDAGGSHHVA